MTVEKACGYIREALEEMGYGSFYHRRRGEWLAETTHIPGSTTYGASRTLLLALDSLDPMGTTYKEEG